MDKTKKRDIKYIVQTVSYPLNTLSRGIIPGCKVLFCDPLFIQHGLLNYYLARLSTQI